METSVLQLPGCHWYAVAHSKLVPDVFIAVGAENYGIAGGGTLVVVNPTGQQLQVERRFSWPQGLFDCTWSPKVANHVLSSAGDGSIQLWDTHAPSGTPPLCVFKEHIEEVYSLNWSDNNEGRFFLTGSWDGTCKLWDISKATQGSIRTFADDHSLVFATSWSQHRSHLFASVSQDGLARVWDVRGAHPAVKFRVHEYEVLCCDWSARNDNLFATGSVDQNVHTFDLRMVGRSETPLFKLRGHEFAVRQVRFSPHNDMQMASCSYDFTTRVWNIAPPHPHLQDRFERHTEFVVGLDFHPHQPNVLVDCSWDEVIVRYRLSQ